MSLGPAVLPDGSLAAWYRRALFGKHARRVLPVAHCSHCKENWPCDAARLLEALDTAGDREATLLRNWHGDRDKLCDIRFAAESELAGADPWTAEGAGAMAARVLEILDGKP